jgi:hypoxanthine phosphoribosyltransferase
MQPPAEILAARRQATELVSAEAVLKAVDQVAVRMTLALAQTNPLLISVLEGGLPFAGLLLQRLDFPLQIAHVHVGRYGHETHGSQLRWYSKPSVSLAGRYVVFIDDILDQAITLSELRSWALEQGAAAVNVCVLVDKEIEAAPRRPLQADFTALTCPDKFLFGCGMDYQGYWRNLPGIYALAEDSSDPVESQGQL